MRFFRSCLLTPVAMKQKFLSRLSCGILLVLLALLAGACAKHKAVEPGVAGTPDQDAPMRSNFENTDWVLVELNGKPVVIGDHGKTPTIRFDPEQGIVAGNGGLNQFSGSYTTKDGKIEFGPMRSTMMAGPPELMELESNYMKALDNMTGWRIDGGRLLFLNGDKIIAVHQQDPAG